MKRAVVLLVLGLGACATGGEEDELPATGGSGSGGVAGTSGGAGLGGAAGGSGTAGTGGFGGSAGVSGSGGTAGTAGSGGSAGACAAVTSCASPTDLGTMSGDSGADTLQVQGTESEWLRIRVTEDNHSVIGHALEVVVSVDVPADADIDVYAYLNPGQDTSPCGSAPFVKADSGGIGANEVVDIKWGDGLTGSGNDDSRDVLLEVVHKAGPCTTPWSINLAANP